MFTASRRCCFSISLPIFVGLLLSGSRYPPRLSYLKLESPCLLRRPDYLKSSSRGFARLPCLVIDIITPGDLECILCDETAEPQALPLPLLTEITDDFSHEKEIGRGGFAVVYKGRLENRTVAVKRMLNTYMYEKEFQREVECLMIAKHKNVIRFLGYCADTQGNMARHEGKFVMADVQQRLLCFEHLPKGNLYKYITDMSPRLRWRERYHIITGICQGLHYLHQEKIAHLDLKPTNILLDDSLVQKITDFGISRRFDEMQSRALTKIVGTMGYMAPEYFNNTEVTYQDLYLLDIYSLGVVITEMLTGNKECPDVDKVVESWSNTLEKSRREVQREQVRVCAEIGKVCTDFNPANRPDSQHIINRLNGYIETGVVTAQQAKDTPNELHQHTPNVQGVTSSEIKDAPDELHQDTPSVELETISEDGNPLNELHQDRGDTSSQPLQNPQNAKAPVHARKCSSKLKMEVVTRSMGTLLPMLGDLLMEEYSLQKNTKEINFLKAEQESMQAALIKVSEAPLDQPPDIQVKIWARDARDLDYEIEDIVDRFRVLHLECQQQNKAHNFMGFIHRSWDMLTKSKIRHKISIDIKDIKIRIKEVSERRDRYKVDSVAPKPTDTSTDTLRQLAFFHKASELIGTEKKSLDIVRMLMEGDEVFKKQLKMISIVGFGGLGKTTLGNLVYEKLRDDFDCEACVSVSFNPNMEKVFKSLLHELDKGKYHSIMGESAWSEYELIREIRDFLGNKRYLILIDDIWDKSVWKNIRSALIENECGSRVIATTRILVVAKEVGGVYQLKPLSTSDSRRLFNQLIFGSRDKCPPAHLAEVSENILRKCGGVPLAIMTMASMLAGKKGHTYAYWSKVYQSMGSGLANNPDLKDMRRILYVSYHDLPPNLKACLLYLSLYPEDYCIQAKSLIWKWICEGFVHEEEGMSLYEIGEAYFDELINKSLIQPMDLTIANKASSCRVHDMVLDLITSLSNEEILLMRLGGHHPRSVPSKVRRLSLQTSKEENAKKIPTISLSSVRSLTVFIKSHSLLSALSGFPLLRTLDLSGCAEVGNHHMKDICNLLHLRFLSLKGTSITDIPNEIQKLQLLQLLEIRFLVIEKIPSTFFHLRQIVGIDMGDGSVSTMLLRSMSTLPSLSSLIIGLEKLTEENLQALGSMPSLCDLSIYVLSSRQGGEERLVVDNGCPFRCLTRLHIEISAIDFVFTQGTLQMLQILQLDFNADATKDKFGDFHFGLENLTSLEHVYVLVGHDAQKEAMSNAVQKELDINPNQPTLTVKEMTHLQIMMAPSRMVIASRTDGLLGSSGWALTYPELLQNDRYL